MSFEEQACTNQTTQHINAVCMLTVLLLSYFIFESGLAAIMSSFSVMERKEAYTMWKAKKAEVGQLTYCIAHSLSI